MVLSYYLFKLPYRILWRLNNRLKTMPAVVYCAAPLDYIILKPVLKHLPRENNPRSNYHAGER